jgi:hypothetical protein
MHVPPDHFDLLPILVSIPATHTSSYTYMRIDLVSILPFFSPPVSSLFPPPPPSPSPRFVQDLDYRVRCMKPETCDGQFMPRITGHGSDPDRYANRASLKSSPQAFKIPLLSEDVAAQAGGAAAAGDTCKEVPAPAAAAGSAVVAQCVVCGLVECHCVVLAPCVMCGHFGAPHEIYFRGSCVKTVDALPQTTIDAAERFVLASSMKKPLPRAPYRCVDDNNVQKLLRFVLNAENCEVSPVSYTHTHTPCLSKDR